MIVCAARGCTAALDPQTTYDGRPLLNHARKFCSRSCYLRPSGKSFLRPCRTCGTEFDAATGYNGRSGGRLRVYCATKCRKSSLPASAANRASVLKATYGLTSAAYQELLVQQGGVCAICRGPETVVDYRTGRVRHLHVDHDHETNRIRGLLCHACNLGVGNFRDDVTRLRRAVDYLEVQK